jgi:ribosomal protein S7
MRRPKSYIVVRRALYRLRTQFKLVQQRKGKEMEAIPTPIRRNKRDTLNIQMLAVAVARRRESTFPERVVQEFSAITLDPLRSITLRQLDAFHREVYNERANIDRMS